MNIDVKTETFINEKHPIYISRECEKCSIKDKVFKGQVPINTIGVKKPITALKISESVKMKTITIKINESEVVEAKTKTAEFDKQKTHDKFVCKTNYIGLLGEMVLDRYFSEQNIEHEWVSFVKQGWNEPDFKINGLTIDLKTTYSDSMWFQQPKFDIYIYAQISKDNSSLVLTSWMDKEGLSLAKTNGKAKAVKRYNRVDYVINPSEMLPVDLLVGVFPPRTQAQNHMTTTVNNTNGVCTQ